MGPRWARRPEEGSPQESAGVPANTRERARKKANSELLTFVYWWSRGDLNPRPPGLCYRFYMLSHLYCVNSAPPEWQGAWSELYEF